MTVETTEKILPPEKIGEPWHKQTGISREPDVEEITAEGVQKCIVWRFADRLELVRLIVCPEHQGRGIGSEILRTLKRRGKKILVYPLSDDNRDADLERFYRRAGFVPDFFDPDTFVWTP